MPTGSPAPARSRALRAALAPLLLAASGACGGGTAAEGDGLPPPDPAVLEALAKRPDLGRNRVILLGLDGCDPWLVKELVDAGKLPNFKRLLEEGAFGPLRSQLPMLSPLLWTTIATGKFPTEHGVLDFLIRDPNDPSKRITVESRNRQVEAIWEIAGRHGVPVGVVAWLASHPAEHVNGFAVSERTELLAYLYNQPVQASDEGKTWPPGLVDDVRRLRREPSAVPWSEVKEFLDVTEEEFKALCTKEEFTNENRVNNMRLLLAGQENFRRIAASLYRERKPRLFCLYFEMLDAVSHNFMAYRDPVTWVPREPEDVAEIVRQLRLPVDRETVAALARRILGQGRDAPPIEVKGMPQQVLDTIVEITRGAEPEKCRRFRGAVDAAYAWTDRLLGEVMGTMDPDTVLLVVSDHGFASREMKPAFDSSFSSTLGGAQYHNADGVLGVFGKGVRRGFAVPDYVKSIEGAGARLHDVAPTVLALLGFPKAKDMPGRVLAEVFETDLSTGTIPTFESGRSARIARERMEEEERRRAAGPGAGPGAEDEDRSLEGALRNMAAVGYVGAAEDAPVRESSFLATSYEEQGRLDEAEEAWAEALKASRRPNQKLNALYRLGSLRLARGDPAGARKRFEEALAEAEDYVPALAGMARLAEGAREFGKALEWWEKAVLRAPDQPELKVRLAEALRRRAADGTGEPGDLQRAVALIREAAAPKEGEGPKLDHLSPDGQNLYGMSLLDGREFEKAAEAFRAAAKGRADFVNPRTNLGVLHMRIAAAAQGALDRGVPPEGVEDMRRALRENRAEALRWFDQALRIQPRNAKAHFNRAEALFHLEPKDPEEAEAALVLALEIDPGYRKARERLATVRKALGKPGGDPDPPPR